MTAAPRPDIAVVVPVGPSPADAQALPDLVDSLRTFEGNALRALILIDDSAIRRPLARLARASCDVHVVRTSIDVERAGGYRPMVAGTLAGMHLAGSLDVELAVKLDTDALVIGPFARELAAAFRARPELGIVGSYDRSCTGGTRDWSMWRKPILANALPVPARLTREDGPTRIARSDPRAAARRARQLGRAVTHGYRLGEHCLGGAYAVSGAFASWLAEDSNLRESTGWLESTLGEDVVLGLVARSAGFELDGMVGPDEPFALSHVGLPASPDDLLRRGAGIIHSVRNDARVSEDAIRRLYARHRHETGERRHATA